MPNNAGLITGQLYKRYASVEITNPPDTSKLILPNGIRMEFRCTRQAFALPFSSLELTITNLSAQTRNTLVVKDATVQLLAGYELAFGSIFKGKIRTVDHVRKGPDWNTVIKCQDGASAAIGTSSHFTISTKNISKVTVLQALLDDLGLGFGNLNNAVNPPFTIQRGFNKDKTPKFIPAQTNYLHGYTASGNTFNLIRNVARSIGYEVIIANGSPQFSLIDFPAATFLTYLLNPETGLLGSPEHGSPNTLPGTKKFGIIKAKTLLIPQITPGFIVRLQHDRDKGGTYLQDGNYMVQKITTHGDTAGNTWECELELKATS